MRGICEYPRVTIECSYRFVPRTNTPQYMLNHCVIGVYSQLTFFVVSCQRIRSSRVKMLNYSLSDRVSDHVEERIRYLHPGDCFYSKIGRASCRERV